MKNNVRQMGGVAPSMTPFVCCSTVGNLIRKVRRALDLVWLNLITSKKRSFKTNNLMYEGITKDGKNIKIYDNGFCDGDIEFECVYNHFESHLNKKVAETLNKIKAIEQTKN